MLEGSGNDDCSEAIRRIYYFLDGELTEYRRQMIQRHLDECLGCVSAFDFEAELRQVIANRCRDVPPADLMERIAAAIRREASGWDAGPLQA